MQVRLNIAQADKRAIAYYNLACAEALLNNTDSAVIALAQAVDAGYSDVDHLLKDEDLASIRGDIGFNAIATRLLQSKEVDPSVARPRWAPPAKPSVPQGSQAFPFPPLRQIRPNPAYGFFNPAPDQPTIAHPHVPHPIDTEPPVTKPDPVNPESEPEAVAEQETEASTKLEESSPLSSSVAIFEDKLQTLNDMGFTDRRQNILVLVQSKGDLMEAVQLFLDRTH